MYLMAEENTGEPQLGDLLKRLCDQSPRNELGRIARHVRQEEGRKGQGREWSNKYKIKILLISVFASSEVFTQMTYSDYRKVQ